MSVTETGLFDAFRFSAVKWLYLARYQLNGARPTYGNEVYQAGAAKIPVMLEVPHSQKFLFLNKLWPCDSLLLGIF